MQALTAKQIEQKQAKEVKRYSRSPQIIAAEAQKYDILKLLLEGGWDPNSGKALIDYIIL